ncbi:protein FAM43A-like isoform X3 [Petromyzon marinus]|uniref:protein FAM43A-like isoform X3 n=1 Tax=Petromyzon marinus TaxID=7757 RepID=UPI003F70C475
MFTRRRQVFEITGEEPCFPVAYLGSAPTYAAKGIPATSHAVARVWTRSQHGTIGTRMILTVSAQGLRLCPVTTTTTTATTASATTTGTTQQQPPSHLYQVSRVTWCSAPDPARPCLLLWVYRHEGRHKAVVLRCHAALARGPAQARAAAAAARQAARDGLAEFCRGKRLSDARSGRQGSGEDVHEEETSL